MTATARRLQMPHQIEPLGESARCPGEAGQNGRAGRMREYEGAEEPRAVGIAHRLDVAVLVGVEDRGNGDTLGKIFGLVGRDDAACMTVTFANRASSSSG